MKKPVILVTGGNGQMGMEFRDYASRDDQNTWIILNRKELDITDRDAVLRTIDGHRPDVCINCAAYTAVDKAETHPDEAFEVNKDGPLHLAAACKQSRSVLIHYSTDYVYHFVDDRPILESDPCVPQSVYARSKKAGEEMIEREGCRYIILRVSWLYSSYGNNFVKTMLRLGESRDELEVVADQYGSPTYARDLVAATMEIIKKMGLETGVEGVIYNYSNAGKTTWHGFAKAIFQNCGIKCAVHETTTRNYNAPAQRPLWSVLSKEKIEEEFGLIIVPWEKSLSECLDLLTGKN